MVLWAAWATVEVLLAEGLAVESVASANEVEHNSYKGGKEASLRMVLDRPVNRATVRTGAVDRAVDRDDRVFVPVWR